MSPNFHFVDYVIIIIRYEETKLKLLTPGYKCLESCDYGCFKKNVLGNSYNEFSLCTAATGTQINSPCAFN